MRCGLPESYYATISLKVAVPSISKGLPSPSGIRRERDDQQDSRHQKCGLLARNDCSPGRPELPSAALAKRACRSLSATSTSLLSPNTTLKLCSPVLLKATGKQKARWVQLARDTNRKANSRKQQWVGTPLQAERARVGYAKKGVGGGNRSGRRATGETKVSSAQTCSRVRKFGPVTGE